MTGALAAAFLFGNAAPLCAADIKLETNNGKARITLRGKILRGDAEKFSALLKSARDNGISVSFLELNSQGGALLDGVKMSDIVRQAKMTTSVPELGMCASACFLIFAGGNERIMHPVSHLGVHGASDAKGQETIISGSATIMMARKFKELGVPPAVIGKMVVTPPEKTVWLTSSDLSEMGVKIVRGLSSSPTLPTTTVTTVPSGSKASQSLIAIYGAPQDPQPSQGEASPPAAAAIDRASSAGKLAEESSACRSEGRVRSRRLRKCRTVDEAARRKRRRGRASDDGRITRAQPAGR
jgi:hypothetical protein